MMLISAAFAYEVVGATWPTGDGVHYEVATPLGGDLSDDEAMAAIDAAFVTWGREECAPEFVYDGRADDATWGEEDGRNVLFVFDDGFPDEATLASAPNVVLNGSVLLDVDVAFNAHDYAWAVDGTPPVMDFQASVTHEIGHLLGLWHSEVTTSTLHPSMNGNPEARTLDPDDVEGLCALYARGDGAVGDPCGETRDCTEGLLCVANGDAQTCASTCESDAECVGEESCVPAGDVSVCVGDAPTSCGCASGGGGTGLLGLIAAMVVHRRLRVPRTGTVTAPAADRTPAPAGRRAAGGASPWADGTLLRRARRTVSTRTGG